MPEVLLSAEAVALVEAPAGSSAGGRPGTRVAFTRDTTCSPSALCEGPGVVAPMGSVGRWSVTGSMPDALTGCVDCSPACDCLSLGAIVALAWKLISFDGLRPVATRSRGQRRRPRRRRRVSSPLVTPCECCRRGAQSTPQVVITLTANSRLSAEVTVDCPPRVLDTDHRRTLDLDPILLLHTSSEKHTHTHRANAPPWAATP